MAKDLMVRSSVEEFLTFKVKEKEQGIQVRYENENLLMTQKAMAEKSSATATDGKRYKVKFYNLDAIISVGYRVNSIRATQFRRWATNVLKTFTIQGYVLDKERMKNGSFIDKDYFEKLLEEIREIRLSERRFYQKITDIYATSVDYDPKSPTTMEFFKKVQNKMHYAVSHQTASELIYNRADAEKEHMGLTNWKNSPDGLIYKYDVKIAKNYLNEEELKKLNDLTNFFIVFAEDETRERHIMTMQNWIDATDDLLKFRRKKILDNAGSISHKEAIEKAENEYEKFKVKQDIQYISSMDEMYQRYLNENKE